jgi:hypothetical protein
MKKALPTRSPRAAGLAVALALGLAAASHSAQAAIVQITLGSANGFKYSLSGPAANMTQLDVTLDGTPDSVYLLNNGSEVGLFNGPSNMSSDFIAYSYNYGSGFFALSGNPTFTFQHAGINGGALTTGYAQGVGFGDRPNNVYTATLTRVVFDDASTVAPTNFDANTNYPEFGASSTAVPEPGAFIPAAALVMGALLQRRRSRSHRGSRATA